MEKNTILDKLESFNEQLNLTHYWIILLKYKKIILILPLFFGLLGYLVGLNILPTFQSNATLVIEKQDKKIVDIDEVYSAIIKLLDENKFIEFGKAAKENSANFHWD